MVPEGAHSGLWACSMGTPQCFCDALSNEAWACAWCGKQYWVQQNGIRPLSGWCNDACQQQHKAANPDSEHFRGWAPIADTVPGGPLDGIWEASGLALKHTPASGGAPDGI